MKEVSKDQFKHIYFKYEQPHDGWGQNYWDSFFENDSNIGMKYLAEEPPTPNHNRMMIVTDKHLSQYRLFFMTEESEDSLFDH